MNKKIVNKQKLYTIRDDINNAIVNNGEMDLKTAENYLEQIKRIDEIHLDETDRNVCSSVLSHLKIIIQVMKNALNITVTKNDHFDFTEMNRSLNDSQETYWTEVEQPERTQFDLNEKNDIKNDKNSPVTDFISKEEQNVDCQITTLKVSCTHSQDIANGYEDSLNDLKGYDVKEKRILQKTYYLRNRSYKRKLIRGSQTKKRKISRSVLKNENDFHTQEITRRVTKISKNDNGSGENNNFTYSETFNNRQSDIDSGFSESELNSTVFKNRFTDVNDTINEIVVNEKSVEETSDKNVVSENLFYYDDNLSVVENIERFNEIVCNNEKRGCKKLVCRNEPKTIQCQEIKKELTELYDMKSLFDDPNETCRLLPKREVKTDGVREVDDSEYTSTEKELLETMPEIYNDIKQILGDDSTKFNESTILLNKTVKNKLMQIEKMSVKQFVYMSPLIENGRFFQYDYELKEDNI